MHFGFSVFCQSLDRAFLELMFPVAPAVVDVFLSRVSSLSAEALRLLLISCRLSLYTAELPHLSSSTVLIADCIIALSCISTASSSRPCSSLPLHNPHYPVSPWSTPKMASKETAPSVTASLLTALTRAIFKATAFGIFGVYLWIL